MIVVCVWLYGNDRWAPISDLATTELRVRDVGTVHTPLLGLAPGRAGWPKTPSSHPGPLSFYLLAPVYRLLGGSYWALRVSTVAFQAAAIALVLWIARWRAGTPGVIGAGLMIAFLELGYGLLVLTEPWNPYLPVLWFLVFLAAVWSVACGDLWMLPLAVASGSLCAQTHLPYAAVCGALGFFAFLLIAASWVRAWRRGSGTRGHARSLVASAAVLAVLWAPPLLAEWTREPGNLRILLDFFENPPEASVGLPSGLSLTFQHLDPAHLTIHAIAEPGLFRGFFGGLGDASRGVALLVLWLGAVAMAVKLGNRTLMALHGVVAASVVVAVIAISRIVGAPWPYLTLWAWGIDGAMLVAVVATAGLGVSRRMSERSRMRWAPAGMLGVAAIALCAVRLAMGANAAGSMDPRPSAQVAQLAPDTAAAIRRGVGAATGDKGTYLVTFDPYREGTGLVNELERRGLHVGVAQVFGPAMTPHRVLDPQEATARIHLASIASLDRWQRTPGAVQVAFSDPRTPQQLEEFGRMRAQVIDALRREGREDVVAAIDLDFAGVNLDRVAPWTVWLIQQLRNLGYPEAVFILPVDGRATGR